MIDNGEFILLNCPEQIEFFLGGYAEGILLLGNDKKILITDDRYLHQVESKRNDKTIIDSGRLEDLLKYVPQNSKIGVDYSVISVELFDNLKEHFQVFDASKEIASSISIKSENQIGNIKKSCKIAEKSFKQVLKFIREGISELELSAELEYLFKKNGASGTSFDTIVAFGENSAIPHHSTSARKLKNNEVILMDFGCKYNGFCSDMTRTLFFGEPTDEFLKIYGEVRIAQDAAKNAIKSGMTAVCADEIARNSLRKVGLAEYFTHSLGHGIGTLIHEYPYVSPRGTAILHDGNVFSIEPGVYLNDKFGVRIEDTVRLENGNIESFMSLGNQLIIIK